MSEEEILEEINELKDNCECWIDDDNTSVEEREWFEKEELILQGLLDLYNKEKEKNKKLEEEKESCIKGYSQACEDVVDATIHLIEQKDFYEKVIDIMVEDIAKDDPIIVKLSNESKEVKEYYFKKAKENK